MFKFSFSIGLYDTLCARHIQKQYNNREFLVELKTKLFLYYWMDLIFFNTCSSQSDVGFIFNSFSCCFCCNQQIFLKPVWTAVYKWVIIATPPYNLVIFQLSHLFPLSLYSYLYIKYENEEKIVKIKKCSNLWGFFHKYNETW